MRVLSEDRHESAIGREWGIGFRQPEREAMDGNVTAGAERNREYEREREAWRSCELSCRISDVGEEGRQALLTCNRRAADDGRVFFGFWFASRSVPHRECPEANTRAPKVPAREVDDNVRQRSRN